MDRVAGFHPVREALRARRRELHRLRVREWTEEESKKRTVSSAEKRRRKKQIAEELLPLIFFPNQVRVLGRTVEVFVPEAFLGRPGPRLVEGYRALLDIVGGLTEING